LKAGSVAVVVVEITVQISTALLPLVGLVPGLLVRVLECLAALGELLNGNIEKLALVLEFGFGLVQSYDVVVGAVQDGTLVLAVSGVATTVCTWDDLRDVLDALVDDFTAATLDYRSGQ
jgi:hypothetical protein